MPWASLANFFYYLNPNRMCKLYGNPSAGRDTVATKIAAGYGDIHKCYAQTTQPNAPAGLGFANAASWFTSTCAKAHSTGDKHANSDTAHYGDNYVYNLGNINCLSCCDETIGYL